MPIIPIMTHHCSFRNSKLAEKNIFEKLEKYKYDKTEWFEFKNLSPREINTIIQSEFNRVESFMKDS